MAGPDDAPYGRSKSGYVYGPGGAQSAYVNSWLNRRMEMDNPTDNGNGMWQVMSGRFPNMLQGAAAANEYRTYTDNNGRPLRKGKRSGYGGDGDDIPDLDYGGAGSPYDEDTFMPMPNGPNDWLNSRLSRRLPDSTMGYITGDDYGGPQAYRPQGRFDAGRTPSYVSPGMSDGGSDMDMMMIYGPEDQVAFDAQGRPIRLDDPRHPSNQSRVNPMLQSYPQQRR